MEPFGPFGRRTGVHSAESARGQPFTPADATPPDSAVEQLYRTDRTSLVRLAHVMTGSNAVAEELVQEAFLRLHEREASVQNPAGFLRTVVVNLCRSHLRRVAKHRSIADDVPPTLEIPELDETWSAIQRLPGRQRAVLALRYYEDLPEREIAALLGCRLGTVKSAHHRALATLRKELS